jgi:Tfp pilus assembly protein PilX
MNVSKNISRNEKGSVLVIALVILVLITLMGISVTRTSDIDIQIAKNEQEYVQEFYVADSAWREAIQWLDTRAQAPGLVNKALFIGGDTSEHVFNVRNYGDGGNGVLNNNYAAGTQDGTLGTGARAVDYWYKIAYLDEAAMTGVKAPMFGEGFRRYSFVITSVANGAQRVDVTVTKILPTGE